MRRFYTNYRFADETKYWIEQLIECRNKQPQQLSNSIMLHQIEGEILIHYPLDGIEPTIALDVTAGSIIECAVKEAEKLSSSEWKNLEVDIVNAKESVPCSFESSLPQRVYLSIDSHYKLEDMQRNFKQTHKREICLPDMVKLVIYNLYKKIFI